MQNNINKNVIKFCCNVIQWIKKKVVYTHNENVNSYQENYKSGCAFAYYEVYSLLQMQADAFLIPLSIIGLEDIKEQDLLSLFILKEKTKMIKSIPDKYVASVIGWMSDSIYLIKEDALKFKQLFNINQNERDYKYHEGKLISYFEIITFMQKQAKKLGISFQKMNLDSINPDKDLM